MPDNDVLPMGSTLAGWQAAQNHHGAIPRGVDDDAESGCFPTQGTIDGMQEYMLTSLTIMPGHLGMKRAFRSIRAVDPRCFLRDSGEVAKAMPLTRLPYAVRDFHFSTSRSRRLDPLVYGPASERSVRSH